MTKHEDIKYINTTVKTLNAYTAVFRGLTMNLNTFNKIPVCQYHGR